MKPATLRTRAAVGRADLLRVYAEHGEKALVLAAIALGYERQPTPAPAPVTASFDITVSPNVKFVVDTGPPPLPERPAVLPAARFFHVTEHRQSDPPPAAGPEAPDWLARARVLTNDTCPAPGSVRLPARQPLTRWSRLWPFLRSALGQTLASRQPDLARLLDRLTRGEVLRAIPMVRRHGWSPRIAILSDHSRQTVPFHGDFSALNHALERRHGKLGIERRILHGEPGAQPLVRKPLHSATQRWQLPAAATPLLILSDLGLIDRNPETLRGWMQFGGRLRRAACPALVLCPVPARRHPASLQRCFDIVEWDRHSLLRRSLAQVANTAVTGERDNDNTEHSTDKLLTLLAPAVVIEPALLRAIRHLLPAREADVLAEAMAWQHPDVQSAALAFQFAGAAAIEKYQRKFAELPAPQQEAAVRLIVAHHAALPESVRLGELATCRRLAPHCALGGDDQLVERWQHDIARTALECADSPALQQWLNRHIGRQTDAMFADNEALAALWALAQRQRLAQGEVLELPPGVEQQDVTFFLQPEPVGRRVRCALRQRGQELRLEALVDSADETTTANASPYAELTLVDGGVFVRVTQLAEAASDDTRAESADSAALSYVAAGSLPQTIARLGRHIERIELRSKHLELAVSALSRPAWAQVIGRDAAGLFAEVDWLEQRCRLDWQAPQPRQFEQLGTPGRWISEQPLGVDSYGLFAQIAIAGVSQRFRWIAPGRFLMGSPPDEPQRFKDEVQHEVTLSRGFWLADTACTQALWQAITSANPSDFKGDGRNPVENVSWSDVQAFLGELNRRVPGLHVRLPSEAEWEYACRAGTTTPFSFGDNITPEQVNYDGNHPYNGGEKGLYREKTVPVRALPANPWGLYGMHGNVWEWCADWYADYPNAPQVDPTGPQTGAFRVVRGSAWSHVAGDARCGKRFRRSLGTRDQDIGFRFALSNRGLAELTSASRGGTPPTLTERIRRWFTDR